MEKNQSDIFASHTIYPSAETVFNIQLAPIKDVRNNCIFVLDTNALLVPYSIGSHSLKEIKKVFEQLKNQGRLFIPGQVAREFANNRPEKLKEIFQQLTRKQNSLQNLGIGKYPLLEELKEYREALELEQEINGKVESYREIIKKLIAEVRSWTWNDPISLIYRELFTAEIIVEPVLDKDKVRQELSYRYSHKIPPGFKDSGKADDGIGDLLIWLTILEIAKRNKDVIFVSGDEKNDWFHLSEKQALYPRFELIMEFQSISKGKSFHIIKLSQLLNLFDADQEVVKEVEIKEKLDIDHKAPQYVSSIEAFNRWLANRPNVAIIIRQDSSPQYTIQYINGVNVGVDMYFWDIRTSPELISMRINQSLISFRKVQNKLAKLDIYIIVNDNNIASLISIIETMELNSLEFILTIYIGFMIDSGIFQTIIRIEK